MRLIVLEIKYCIRLEVEKFKWRGKNQISLPTQDCQIFILIKGANNFEIFDCILNLQTNTNQTKM
jgi:hypothetical protein